MCRTHSPSFCKRCFSVRSFSITVRGEWKHHWSSFSLITADPNRKLPRAAALLTSELPPTADAGAELALFWQLHGGRPPEEGQAGGRRARGLTPEMTSGTCLPGCPQFTHLCPRGRVWAPPGVLQLQGRSAHGHVLAGFPPSLWFSDKGEHVRA